MLAAADNGVVTVGAQVAWARLSKADQKKQLMYHFVKLTHSTLC
jgi:hypothetical protein